MPHSLDLNSINQKFYTELDIVDFILTYLHILVILFLFYTCCCSVKMPKVFYCSKCASQHSRPVGKRYQVAGESLVSDVEDAAPPSPSVSGISSVSGQILLQLQQLGEKMDNMDRRVQWTEAALDQGNSQASSAVISAKNLSEKNLVQGPR